MKNKIPPPIVAFVCGLAIYSGNQGWHVARYFSSTGSASILFPYSSLIGNGFLVLGFGVIIVAVSSFRKYQTTINPLEPKTASTLVTDGIFRFSRNPMYLGLLIILLGVSIHFSIYAGLVWCPLFVIYMNYFQISPEEEAMLELFEENFVRYKGSVRRWL